MKDRVILNRFFNISGNYDISIPGLSDTISLVKECYCINDDYDLEEGVQIVSAKANCEFCYGSGLHSTDNGKAILDFIKKYGI